MFDIKKTIDLIKGGLLEPRATWQSYLGENRGWQETAILLTLPMIIVAFVLAGILSWIFGSMYMFGRGGIGFWLINLVMAAIAIAAAGFIFSYLAGVFKGRHDFNKGLAAVSLAAIPGYVGTVLGTLPWIGWIISLALGIVSLVFLYQIIPSYLEVPDDKRVLHYVVSLVATLVIMMVLGAIVGAGGMSGMSGMQQGVSTTDHQPAQSGVVGNIQRHARMMEQAEQDRYDPPADGKITEQQMAGFMDVMRKAAEIQGEHAERMKSLSEQYTEKDSEAVDLMAAAGSVSSLMGAFNAEMEVVMTGEGNWAEHQWVKEQLRVARVQKDANEAVRHNYELYQANKDALQQLDPTL